MKIKPRPGSSSSTGAGKTASQRIRSRVFLGKVRSGPDFEDTLTPEQKARMDSIKAANTWVTQHPEYTVILSALRDGTPVREIAKWLADEGLLGITESTFANYISLFKKANPEILREHTGAFQGATLSNLFPNKGPVMDLEREILRLLKLQQARVTRAFEQETRLGINMELTHKEVEEARELLKLLGIAQGKMSANGFGGGSGSKSRQTNASPSAIVGLNAIQKDEESRDRMASLVAELVEGYAHDTDQS